MWHWTGLKNVLTHLSLYKTESSSFWDLDNLGKTKSSYNKCTFLYLCSRKPNYINDCLFILHMLVSQTKHLHLAHFIWLRLTRNNDICTDIITAVVQLWFRDIEDRDMVFMARVQHHHVSWEWPLKAQKKEMNQELGLTSFCLHIYSLWSSQSKNDF